MDLSAWSIVATMIMHESWDDAHRFDIRETVTEDMTITKSAHGRYDALASARVHGIPAVRGMIFGNPSFMVHGKIFAGRFGEAMVFKLGGVAHVRALSLAGMRPSDPLRRDRPMEKWVEVPRRRATLWPALARAAQPTVRRGGTDTRW
jgi:hypothetical protein